MSNMSAPQLAAHLESESPMLLDVRGPWEYESRDIESSINAPIEGIPQYTSRLQQAGEIVVICHHDIRSRI